MSKKQSKISVGEKVKTIEDYLSKIKEIEPKGNVFYRGHSDKNFKLIPSIYRNDNIIKNEHLIYRETISKVPYDFNGKSTIESLVLMQHYGIPTRILDLTTNALVALYFACIDNKESDGEVIVFDIPQESTCYFDSDRVTILANLAKCDDKFYYTFGNFYLFKDFKEKLERLKEKYKVLSFDEKLEKEVDPAIENLDNYFFLHPDEIEIWLKQFGEDKKDFSEEEKKQLDFIFLHKLEHKINSLIWQNRLDDNEFYFGKLLHYIREDKSYFQAIIDSNDVAKVFAIFPKLDNPRIVRQQGAFLIFGTKEKHISSYERNQEGKKESMPEVPLEWIKAKIEIDVNSKNIFLKELSQLGIDKSTLFPEIEKIAEYIKEKYNQ